MVEEAKKCHLDIVGVSSTKSVILKSCIRIAWEVFLFECCSKVSPSGCGKPSALKPLVVRLVFDLILLGSRACMLKIEVKDRPICLLQVFVPTVLNEYQAIMDDVNDALQRIGSRESTILLGNFNAHIGTDNETWKGVIGKHGDPAFNKNGRYLLQFCCSNGL